MNYRALRSLCVQTSQIPYIRIAFVTSVALILLIAGLVTIRQSSAAGAGAEIRATGTFTTNSSPRIAEQTNFAGLASVFLLLAVNEFTGSLEGTLVSLHTRAVDNRQTIATAGLKKTFATTTGTFWGRLALGSDSFSDPGSFSSIVHLVIDRSNVDIVPFEGKFVVVEGTGKGGLEGICGGGTFENVGVTGVATTYDFTFRFGKDCKANN